MNFNNSQQELFFNLETSKNLKNQKWTSIFKIFRSLRIVSKYARKYRRKANFSKRRKFRPNIKKRGYFIATKGATFKRQRLFSYPFKPNLQNTQRWSYSINRVRVSPVMARYGAYLDRINALSKKFKSKVRVFSLNSFKNRLNLNFDKSKFNSSYSLYFRRFFKESFTQAYKYKFSLKQIKNDKFVKSWDRKQFYANPISKFLRNKSIKNRQRTSRTYNFRRESVNSNRFPSKIVGSRGSFKRRPSYWTKFTK